eukprot:364214-Chlamydomonas_euryale.AAC.3
MWEDFETKSGDFESMNSQAAAPATVFSHRLQPAARSTGKATSAALAAAQRTGMAAEDARAEGFSPWAATGGCGGEAATWEPLRWAPAGLWVHAYEAMRAAAPNGGSSNSGCGIASASRGAAAFAAPSRAHTVAGAADAVDAAHAAPWPAAGCMSYGAARLASLRHRFPSLLEALSQADTQTAKAVVARLTPEARVGGSGAGGHEDLNNVWQATQHAMVGSAASMWMWDWQPGLAIVRDHAFGMCMESSRHAQVVEEAVPTAALQCAGFHRLTPLPDTEVCDV